jgi:RNase H-fold protein (predicted Holliday junction resolvase)
MKKTASFPPTTLAIDYGQKRVGLAVSFGSLAEPVGILTHDETFLPNLARVIEEYQVEQILVGLSEGVSAQKARQSCHKSE